MSLSILWICGGYYLDVAKVVGFERKGSLVSFKLAPWLSLENELSWGKVKC